MSDTSRSDRIADDTCGAALEVTSSVGWRCDTRANRLAVFVETCGEVALNTIVDDPVVTAVGINPNACFKLAEVLFVDAAIDGFVRTLFADLEILTASNNCCKGDKRSNFQNVYVLIPSANADDFDAAILCHAGSGAVGRSGLTLAVAAYIGDTSAG